MSTSRVVAFWASLFLVFFTSLANAAEDGKIVRVGIRDVRPFIFLEDDHLPRGYSIDLWEAVSREANIDYRYLPSSGIGDTLQQMREGKIDMAIGAITITEQREIGFDFSYSHFHTGLGIMTPAGGGRRSFTESLVAFFTMDRQLKVSGFLLFLVVSAHAIWLIERKNGKSFHYKYLPGIFEGMYWSLVTASTVGYGDYVPKSRAGKMLASLIIIVSLPLFAVFVADISSFFTLSELKSSINSPQDLAGKRIGAVSGSTSEQYLTEEHLTIAKSYRNAAEMFADLGNGSLDAVVHDMPTLQYYAITDGKGKVSVVNDLFDKQDYGFLYPEHSRLKEPIDRALLKLTENGTVAEFHRKWFEAVK